MGYGHVARACGKQEAVWPGFLVGVKQSTARQSGAQSDRVILAEILKNGL